MMYYDHAMLGAAVSVVAGAHRRHGWPLVAAAAVAAMLPDWDGLAGPAAYRAVHRVWGHNLPAALLAGALFGAAVYLAYRAAHARLLVSVGGGNRLSSASSLVRDPPSFRAGSALGAWVAVGMLAGLSHSLADVFYSRGVAAGPDWPVGLLWPLSQHRWAIPVMPWLDRGSTLILLGGTVAMLARPAAARLIACAELLVLACHVVLSAAGLHLVQ
jgi:membrane-bound metal-dependent hydrolase YbcI (DUF457 family)